MVTTVLCLSRMGKTTLLLHVAERKLSIPPNIDVLYCEQGMSSTFVPLLQVEASSSCSVLPLPLYSPFLCTPPSSVLPLPSLPLPPFLPPTYLFSEVKADDTPAVDAVLSADKKRLALLEEEKKLVAESEAGNDSNSERLKQVPLRQTGRQTDRQTDRQADRQADLSQSLCTKSSNMKGQFLKVSLWILAQLQPHLVW